ncbi:splicing factor, proline- and glutamine-rich-like [Suricata suricatta]|uniref:splicing factor, proline- and glutamine-rich-like n=1 Tax=Suricata suricatta TaxID=37032 RepID=UPI0011554970|nr:splicing factor, proline- and glutamine-rich-like [Suricata suricatta]
MFQDISFKQTLDNTSINTPVPLSSIARGAGPSHFPPSLPGKHQETPASPRKAGEARACPAPLPPEGPNRPLRRPARCTPHPESDPPHPHRQPDGWVILSPTCKQGEGHLPPTDVEVGRRDTPPPAAITSGTTTSLFPERRRPPNPSTGVGGHVLTPGEATGAPIPLPAGNADPLNPPALHLRKRGRNLCERLRLTPPPAPFYRPLPDLPHPYQPAQRKGEGKQAVIGRKPSRPSGGCAPRSRGGPAPVPPIHPTGSAPFRLIDLLDSQLLLTLPWPLSGEGSRLSKPSDELS